MTYDVQARGGEWAATEVDKWANGEDIGYTCLFSKDGAALECFVYLQAQGRWAMQRVALPVDEAKVRAGTRRAMEKLGRLITDE
jgi:hypothetical protein